MKVLQRRIEQLFQLGVQAVHLIHKKHLELFHVAQDRRQIFFVLDDRARGPLKRHVNLIGNDGGERCLPQAWRAVEQDMVQHFAARLGRLDRNFQVVLDLLLPDELPQELGAQTVLKGLLAWQRRAGNNPVSFFAGHGFVVRQVRLLLCRRVDLCFKRKTSLPPFVLSDKHMVSKQLYIIDILKIIRCSKSTSGNS